MNTQKKRSLQVVHAKTLKVKVAKKISAETATRAARMESYMRGTRGVFLSNLQLAEDMQVSGHGVLAGPVAKRA